MRKSFTWYKHIISGMFLVVLFALFGINISETFENCTRGETAGIREIARDFETVETATYPFVNLNGLYQTMIQRRYIYDADPSNDLIITKENQLVSVSSPVSDKDLEASALELKKTSEWLEAQGIPLVYIQAFTKLCMSEEAAMPGQKNYSYGKLERFLEFLEDNEIDYIDSRELINKPVSEVFYKTDHHWKNDACFDLMKGVFNHLNSEYEFRIPSSYYDRENYSFDVHKNSFLGAEGRRTGKLAVGLDDFTLIKPKFDTSFNVEISDKDSMKTLKNGSFEESIMDKSKDLDRYSFEDSAYYVYWGGDYGRVQVTNNNNTDAKKVLVIKDSYAIPISALMTPAFSRIDIIDIRYYNDEKSIRDIVMETNPDAVMIIYGIGYLTKSNMFKL